jgi:hypothetical protein
MAFNPEPFRAGQVLSAKALNAFFAELERLGKIAVIAPVTMVSDAAGVAFGVEVSEVWNVKLTGGGTGGDYDWTRQIGVVGGGWDDHPSGQTGTTGDDPAHEMNDNDVVDLTGDPVVRAWRDPISRVLLFQSGTC